MSNSVVIGVDATNIRSGGGLTHLVELLNETRPDKYNISKIIIWSGSKTLDAICDKPWLIKRTSSLLNKNILFRTFFQKFYLTKEVKRECCDILFVPGGSYTGSFSKTVIMSQNLLPFQYRELKRYGFSKMFFKLLLLRFVQSHSFRNAKEVIFLSEYARDAVQNVTGKLKGKTPIIPHGINQKFCLPPKNQLSLENYSEEKPFKLLYVSIIDVYKHQDQLIKAVYQLRSNNIPIELNLIGPAYEPALKKLNKIIDLYDVERKWIKYHGQMPYNKLHDAYFSADIGVFASTCENLPIILLENMAAGLPIAASNKGPMQEVLSEGGCFFDPLNSNEIADTLQSMILSEDLRTRISQISFLKAKNFSWTRCADETMKFLVETACSD